MTRWWTLGGLMAGVNNERRVERHKRLEDLGPGRRALDRASRSSLAPRPIFNRTLVSLASTNNKSDVFSPH